MFSPSLPSGHHPKYIRHVDGLRAVAVIPVVIYHIISMFCPGGYVGVDVFFVISGFLITKGIIGDLQRGDFSLTDFYVRRIKRIIPAYFTIIFFVAASFLFLSSYKNYLEICKASIASAFYSANIYFYANTNYFDLPADKNPLLHLWSLGVEEQFYLLIPLSLMLLWRCGKRTFKLSIAFLTVASLAGSIVALHTGVAGFAFYLLPCRAWELLAGSLIAAFPLQNKPEGKVASVMALTGGGMIAGACWFYSDATPFPGVAALLPVAGAMLVILFGDKGPCGALLEWRPVVFIGKISYSLYLWHWPLTLIIKDIDPPGSRVLWTLSASFTAAYLSYLFVETPFRKPGILNGRRAFTLLVGGSIALVAGCMLFPPAVSAAFPKIAERSGEEGLQKWDGHLLWPSAFKISKTSETACDKSILDLKDGRIALPIGAKNIEPNFVLWGDSHALALLPGFDELAKETNKSGIYINLKHSFTCRGEKLNKPYDPRPDKIPVIDWLEGRSDISDVILANRWLSRVKDEADIQELTDLCLQLKSMGKRVFVLTTVPEADEKALRRYSWGLEVEPTDGRSSLDSYRRMAVWQNRMIEAIVSEGLATVIPLHLAFLEDDHYRMFIDGKSCYQDGNHLNPYGSIVGIQHVATLIWPDSNQE